MAAIENRVGPDLQELDKEHHLHPFTDHKELHAKKSRIITRADGVYIYDSEGMGPGVNLVNVTITGNTADSNGDGNGNGGGIHNTGLYSDVYIGGTSQVNNNLADVDGGELGGIDGAEEREEPAIFLEIL